MLDLLPDLINALARLLAERTILDPLESLLELLRGAGTDDDGVPVLLLQRRIVCDPSIGKLGTRGAFFLRDGLPLRQCVEERRLHVHLAVHAAQGFLGEAPSAVANLLCCLGEKATGQRAVCIEGNSQLAQRWEEESLLQARHGAVVALVHGREHVVVGLADVVHLLHIVSRVVGQTEAFESAGLVHLVDTGKSFFEIIPVVRTVDVEDVDLGRSVS